MAEVRARHPYHMYDAMHAQPRLASRMLESLALIRSIARSLRGKQRIFFVGIGTSLHAAQIAACWMRAFTAGEMPAHAEQSFEFVHYPVRLSAADVVVVITHTGSTTFSVESLRMAKSAGSATIAICGENPGEAMRSADHLITTCEQEVCFAYTKSYSTALLALLGLCLGIASENGYEVAKYSAALRGIPSLMAQALGSEPQIREMAHSLAARELLYFAGGGPNWATAQEGALKVKEASYMASEGFETEQLLHGPFSQIDLRVALVALLGGGRADQRLRTVLQAAGEVGVWRLAIAPANAAAAICAEQVIEVPEGEELLSPLVHLMPVQLISYFVTLERGCNPDTGRQDQAAHASAARLYKY